MKALDDVLPSITMADMRKARMLVPEDRAVGYYHCLSRVVDRRFVLGEVEKEHFRELMRECEAFCGVTVLTYCLMSNHFHLLVEVPKPPETLPSAEEVLAKLKRLSGHQNIGAVEQQLEMYRSNNDTEGERALLARFHARMWNLSAFMKLLKQRFTQWHNTRTERRGTLWEERFKSVLVEGAGKTLAAMAAYIDLNPVRAGLVKDPKEYRWSGYGEAMAGQRRAQTGLRTVAMALRGGAKATLKGALQVYRVHLYREGSEQGESLDSRGRPVRGALKHEEVLRVLANKGRLPLHAYLRCRVRYFSDGVAFGGREFTEDLFRQYRERFGPKRKTGARRMRGLSGEAFYTLRDLRLNPFG